MMNTKRIERLYMVTASENKFADYQFLLGKVAELRWAKIYVEDPVTTDLAILVRRKIERVRKQLPHLDFIVEQTNLMIQAWKDLPGNMTGLFIDGVGVEGICKMLDPFDDRRATAVTDLGYHAADGKVYIFRGQITGTITREPRGSRAFGWENIFVPDSHDYTLAEMGLEQRNSISTRKLAVVQFITEFLQEANAGLLVRNRIRLRELITRHFSKGELETLCFDLAIDRDEIQSGTKTEMAQEIILYCERLGFMPALLDLCRQHRPNVDWPERI
jgi:non-canonical purine NTP pyrophosphatase (RdgB/HAM1 family)